MACFFYNDGRGVGDDNSNEGDRNLKWFVIFLPHTSRHIGITGILDHNGDLSWILRHVYFWSFKLKNSVWKKYVIGPYQLTPMISEWCWSKKLKPCFNTRTHKVGWEGGGVVTTPPSDVYVRGLRDWNNLVPKPHPFMPH